MGRGTLSPSGMVDRPARDPQTGQKMAPERDSDLSSACWKPCFRGFYRGFEAFWAIDEPFDSLGATKRSLAMLRTLPRAARPSRAQDGAAVHAQSCRVALALVAEGRPLRAQRPPKPAPRPSHAPDGAPQSGLWARPSYRKTPDKVSQRQSSPRPEGGDFARYGVATASEGPKGTQGWSRGSAKPPEPFQRLRPPTKHVSQELPHGPNQY